MSETRLSSLEILKRIFGGTGEAVTVATDEPREDVPKRGSL